MRPPRCKTSSSDNTFVVHADIPTLHYKEGRLAKDFVSYFRAGKSASLIVSLSSPCPASEAVMAFGHSSTWGRSHSHPSLRQLPSGVAGVAVGNSSVEGVPGWLPGSNQPGSQEVQHLLPYLLLVHWSSCPGALTTAKATQACRQQQQRAGARETAALRWRQAGRQELQQLLGRLIVHQAWCYGHFGSSTSR
jgi:hypothetical protein